MFVRLEVDELACGTPTDNNWLNTADEAYFVVSGATRQGPIQIPRVSPPPPQDYFALEGGENARNITLWEGYIGDGESALLAVALRDQDNAQLQAIGSTVRAAAYTIGAIFLDPALAGKALSELKNAGEQLVASLNNDGDQTIGSFVVRISNEGGQVRAEWETVTTTAFVSPAPNKTLEETVFANGSNAEYTVRASVEKIRLPKIVSVNSGQCLDVEAASMANRANIQQYPIHGNGNQRWYLKTLGVTYSYPVGFYQAGYYAIMAEHSGKCIDVAGGSRANGANVQQYTPHFGGNQAWIMAGTARTEFVLVNVRSRKVLDVAGISRQSKANVQQYAYNGGPNQRWRFEY